MRARLYPLLWIALAACAPGADDETTATASSLTAGAQYYVDPATGHDVPTAGSLAAPWKSATYAASQIALKTPEQQAGAVINLHTGSLHPPASFGHTLHGTAEAPIVVRPYGGGATVTFDGGLPQLRQPNNEWEPVPALDGGAPDEWRTKSEIATSPGERYASGQMMATKYRLINYAQIGDLRAANQSFHRVPLSDPRPSPGPLLADPSRKVPYVYLGPGVFFAFSNAEKTAGRIHVRLSPTQIRAPGIVDYTGETNPNLLGLSIARKNQVVVAIGAQHIRFERVVVQNGGDATLVFTQPAHHVTFDHGEVYGGRFGVRMEGGTHDLTFQHSIFDGGMAPWTSRSDVKEQYEYIGPPDCPADEHGRCTNGMGAKTHDILVIHAASSSVYDHCTFRRAHDAIQIAGHDVQIRHSLFQDINDEVFQLHTASNVQIYGNVVRQALSVISFALNPTGGPHYIYRNVIDQRAPTRGFRTLPDDVPAPVIWRYGHDVKNGVMPAVHVYQNTFISSHAIDKGSLVSRLFAGDAPTATRAYRNNIHLALELDRVLSWVPPPGSPGESSGNLWFRFHGDHAPQFQSTERAYDDLAVLHQSRPEWELGSLYQDPHLANFTDESFEYAGIGAADPAAPWPNTDYRPLANVGGTPITGLPDLPQYAGIVHAGALPASAPPLAVGVDGATIFPAAGVPLAFAGSDQSLTDAGGDGFELVTLDGTTSHDPNGTIASYSWQLDGKVVATGPSPTLLLAEGTYQIHLVVTDATGLTDSDSVRVRIVAPVPGENLLVCPGFEACTGWELPAGAAITTTRLEIHSGDRALKITQNGTAQVVRQRVAITPGATYTASGWMKTLSLTPEWATLTANVLDANGAILASTQILRSRGNSPYAYAEQVISTGAQAAFIELVGAVGGAGTGKVFLDDLRVRDRNLLHNGRFEVRSAVGSDRDAPGWLVRRGGLVVNDPALARSGTASLAMIGTATTYHLVTQQVPRTPGTSYRVSGWLRTDGTTVAPTIGVRWLDANGANLGLWGVGATTSEGVYTPFSTTFPSATIPASAASFLIELRYEQDLPGTARFDDLLVEPLSPIPVSN